MSKKLSVLLIISTLFAAFFMSGCQIFRTRMQDILTTNVTNETKECLKCHPMEEIDHGSNFKFSHNQHYNNNAKDCKTCHREPKHTKKVTLQLDLKTCRTSECHEKTSPHGKWKNVIKGHGKAADSNSKTCGRCHHKLFCQACHQLDIPHEKGWMKKHGAFVHRKSIKTCTACHGGKGLDQVDFCLICHAIPMPHPKNIKKVHDDIANSMGIKKCFQCHDEKTVCLDCHKTPMPHSKNFIKTHFKEIKNLTPKTCVQCHKNKESSQGGCFGGDCHSKKIGD